MPWTWLAIAAGVIALLGACLWLLRRRRSQVSAIAVAAMERPRVTPEPRPPAAAPPATPASPSPPATAREPLQLALEPVRLSLTLINATLAYRLEVANHGAAALADLRIEADMISAHASLGREEQLAGPGSGAPARHTIAHLAPGETRVVEGEFRLPFPQIVPIRQGDTALLLPLARFRASAAGAAPVVRTFAVGQPSPRPGAGLQPFRLDQGPRIYPDLAQRAFA
ncbi:MAG: hypothetical protein B7Z33_06490 [Sphingomonadales bacterium 12-68-11]|nr:MAG: hypothetical protein B7Z33_06490 [Sphingomonadales bacterium 12-68-11]